MTHGDYGHFTTMQVRRRGVQGLGLHLERLVAATRELFDAELDVGRVSKAVVDALDRSDLDDATVRVTVLEESTPSSSGAADDPAPRIAASVSRPLVHGASPLRLVPVMHQRTLPHIKHVGTFASHHYRRRAVRDGADDALFVDAGGRVLEGTFWNIGFWRGDAVVWPDAAALRGTGERLLREGLTVARVPQSLEVVRVDDLSTFDGAFVVNARGVRAIGTIGDVVWGTADCAGMAPLRQILHAVPWKALAE